MLELLEGVPQRSIAYHATLCRYMSLTNDPKWLTDPMRRITA